MYKNMCLRLTGKIEPAVTVPLFYFSEWKRDLQLKSYLRSEVPVDGPHLGGPGAQPTFLSFPIVEPRVLEL